MEVDIPTRRPTTGDPRLSKGPQRLQINTSVLSPRQSPLNLPSTSRAPSFPVPSKSASDVITEAERPTQATESQNATPVEGNELIKALFQFTETQFKVLSEQEEKKRLECAAALYERDLERAKKTNSFPATMNMFNWVKEKSDTEIGKLDTSLKEHQAVCNQLMAQISMNANFGSSPASSISSLKALPPAPSSEYDKERIDKMAIEIEELKKTSDITVNSVKYYQGRIQRLNTDADEFQSWRHNLETGVLQLPLQTMPEAISNLPQDVKEAQAKADEAHKLATRANRENFSVTQKVNDLETTVSQSPRPDFNAIAAQRSSLENLNALSESHTTQIGELKIRVDNAIKGLPNVDQPSAQLANEGRRVVPQAPNDSELMKTWATRFQGIETMQVQLDSKTNVALEQLRRLLQQEGRWNHTSDLLDKSLRLLKSCEVGVRSLEKRYDNINTGDLVKQMSRFIMETYSSVPELKEEIHAYKTQLSNEIQILQNRTNTVDAPSISDESMKKVEDLIKIQLSPLVEEQTSQSESITRQLRDLHELQGRFESHSTAFQLLIDEDISRLGNKGEKLSADIQLLTESWQSKLGDITGQFETLKSSVEDLPGWIDKIKVLEPVDRIPQLLDTLGSVDDVKEIRNILQEKNNAVSSLEKLNDMIADLFLELGEIRKMIEQNSVLRQSRRSSPTPVTTGQLDGAERISTDSHIIPRDEPVYSPAVPDGESSVPTASVPVTSVRANLVSSAPISGNSTPSLNTGLKVRGHAEKSHSKSKKRRRLALDSDNESQASASSFPNGTPTSFKAMKAKNKSLKKASRDG
ncbi:hypothetical protein N7540_003784 [Penicillium herquei]|nr:hypothetical protein N7540_003784 [Penicillium herquei]